METVRSLLAAYVTGAKTPTDAVRECLAVIKRDNKHINAFLEVYEEDALVAAAAAKPPSAAQPLSGAPIAVKNNILVEGKRATAGSRILESYIAAYDATVVARLRNAGAIIIGSTNLDEFAMGSSTEHSAFGPTRNPLAPERVPGGSSGGSAAAVSMGAVPAAIGTDTGGSIRQPASFCGLVGFKPTYGALSRHGLVAMGSSLDQAGPLTRTVADAELLHTAMAGLDRFDATTFPDGVYTAKAPAPAYTFGVPRSFLKSGLDADVATAFEAHLETLRALGHRVVDIELPLFEQGLAAYYIIMPAEVSSNLARYDGMRYGLSVDGETLLDVYEKTRAVGFGDEVKRRLLLGTYVLSAGYFDAYYKKAEAVRALMRRELGEVFAAVDFIVTPTTPTPAFMFGEAADPLSMYRQDIFTVPVNLTGVPAISFPMGEVKRGADTLPVGVQYIAPHGNDARLFDIGRSVFDERE
jgi:aspartyl-tRNA(Asn)/glutamyl-tRNA(Gln) amidotransferase subunit A